VDVRWIVVIVIDPDNNAQESRNDRHSERASQPKSNVLRPLAPILRCLGLLEQPRACIVIAVREEIDQLIEALPKH
jgi:hypothetical protein